LPRITPQGRRSVQRYSIIAVLCLVFSGTVAPYLTLALISVEISTVQALALLLTPFAFLMWIVTTVRALHLAGLDYWSLASTYVSLICVGVAIVLACIAFIIRPDGSPTNFRDIVLQAAGVVAAGAICWCGWYNCRRTRNGSLAVSVTVLQLTTGTLLALGIIWMLVRDRHPNRDVNKLN
jgi:glucose dehydrogenase